MSRCRAIIRSNPSLSRQALHSPVDNGATKQGNSMARFLLVEAAQTAARYDET